MSEKYNIEFMPETDAGKAIRTRHRAEIIQMIMNNPFIPAEDKAMLAASPKPQEW